jgi:hypothetical protein
VKAVRFTNAQSAERAQAYMRGRLVDEERALGELSDWLREWRDRAPDDAPALDAWAAVVALLRNGARARDVRKLLEEAHAKGGGARLFADAAGLFIDGREDG